MFLRQLIGPSLHLHIHYLRVVHLFALRQLFLITLWPLLLEGNLFNQINFRTIYFVCLCCRQERAEKSNEITQYQYTERCCSGCSSTRTLESNFWLAELPAHRRAPGRDKQDKHTHFVDLWGFKPDKALRNTVQGILCVCLSSTLRQACPCSSQALN